MRPVHDRLSVVHMSVTDYFATYFRLYSGMLRLFLRTLVPNIFGTFKGARIWLHVIAIGASVVIVESGFDWNYLLLTRHPGADAFFFPAVIIGGLVPLIVPLALMCIGAVSRMRTVYGAGWMSAQAALVGSIVSSVYKTFTGRTQPNLHQLVIDSSHGFHFGFLQHGIFWGWPSSHTTIAFSMAVALCVAFPRRRALSVAVLLYALYVGIGVSLSIHWFSEFVAGALIGTACGLSVGTGFAKRLGGDGTLSR